MQSTGCDVHICCSNSQVATLLCSWQLLRPIPWTANVTRELKCPHSLLRLFMMLYVTIIGFVIARFNITKQERNLCFVLPSLCLFIVVYEGDVSKLDQTTLLKLYLLSTCLTYQHIQWNASPCEN